MLLPLLLLVAGVGAAARFLASEIPRGRLGLFLLLSVLPYPRAFVTDRTPLPLDHAMYVLPWMGQGQPPPNNPNLNDVMTIVVPWAKAARVAFKEGSLPLWDRWNGCGTPLAANNVSTALSPLTLVTLLWPLARATTLMSSIKLLLAASGMWLWVRRLGASARASDFAAVAFALSFSFTPPWLYFPHSAVLCLWPWTLFLVERADDHAGRTRVVAALTAVFVFTALAGHPETGVMDLLFVALWIAARWATGGLRRPAAVLSAVAWAAALSLGLTAFLLIPSLYAIAASGRLGAMSEPYWAPILSWVPHGPQWRAFPTAVFPHTLGNGIQSPRLPLAGGSFPETGLGYFGIIGWAAALLFLRPGSPRRRVEWILVALILVGFGVSVGQWPMAEIFGRLPGLRLLFPVRFHSWVALSGAALAAFELDRLALDLPRRRGAAWTAAAVPLALAASAVLVFRRYAPEHALAGGAAFQIRQLVTVLLALGAAAALILVLRRRPAILASGLAVLCGAELLSQWQLISKPLYSPAGLFPPTPLIRFLRGRPGPFRVAGAGAVLFPNTNVFAELEEVRTHDAMERRDYLAFLDATCGYRYQYFKVLRDLDASALDFLNVRYVLTPPGGPSPGARWRLAYDGGDGRAFENANVLARAFVPERIRFVVPAAAEREPLTDARESFGGAFREITANKNWGETAWVLADRSGEEGGGGAAISDFRETTNTAAFRADVGGDGAWVVLSMVQDGGWSAREEKTGAELTLLRANGPFLALRLPAGEHRILLRYRPPGFAAGLGIGALTAAIALGLALVSRSSGRATRP